MTSLSPLVPSHADNGIACVAARATEILPKLAGKSFASESSYSFYFITVFICLLAGVWL